jgi:hypothetical protein
MPFIIVPVACGAPGEVDEKQAANLAADFEAGADNATDETKAQVLREQAKSFREKSQGKRLAMCGPPASRSASGKPDVSATGCQRGDTVSARL